VRRQRQRERETERRRETERQRERERNYLIWNFNSSALRCVERRVKPEISANNNAPKTVLHNGCIVSDHVDLQGMRTNQEKDGRRRDITFPRAIICGGFWVKIFYIFLNFH
jgi:hypothetical protein